MSNHITTPATATTSASTAAIPVSSGQGPGLGTGALLGTGGVLNHSGNPGHVQGGQGQLAQLLQQAAAAAGGHGTNGNSVASLSSTIAASGLVLLPPPPLTSKNLTIHTSLLSTKQQLMQQQQQLQQLHHAQLNAALKKQQQQHQRQIQLQQQQQQQYDLHLLSPDDCSPSALSDGTMGEGIERDGESMSANAGEGDRALPSQPTTRSTTRVTSPTSAFAPGYPLLSSQGDGGMDHYPPPDQWNYTMTRYHASLIPLCQIEEPPTFYEGMDDHPPVETDNDDSDSFFLEERDIRERGTDSSRHKDRDREREYNNSEENISLSSIAKPHPQTLNHSHHDHKAYSQEHLQQRHEQTRLQLQSDAREGHNSHVLQAAEGQCHRSSLPKDEHDNKSPGQETSLPLTKQQRDRATDNSGEQIFFYDGPNLLHAKLHSGGDSDPVKSDGSEGDRFHSSTEPFSFIHSHSKQPLQRSRSHSRSRSRSGSRSRSRSITGNSAVSTRSRSHSRSTSGAWSRTISESLAKKDLLPSSFPPAAKTRPSILMRGFSADSGSRSDNDQKHRGTIFATGAATTTGINESGSGGGGSVRRKATAKERLVAMVTRGGTGTSTATSGGKDRAGAGAHENSLPIKSHRNSMDERSSPRLGHSPILSQTHSRRQGSPSVGRAGHHEYVGLSTGTGASSPPDAMMGFPYNNSSLLMSTDLARGTPSAKAPPTLRTSRSNKPRPFSVATMEKLMASNGSRHEAYTHAHREELSPRQEKYRSLHPHDLPFKAQQQPQYRQHQHSVSNDVLVRGSGDDADLRSKIVSSGSHPLLSTLGSPVSPTSGGLSSPPFSSERRDSKGKEAANRSRDRLSVSSSKVLKTTTTPEPAINDPTSNAGAVLVHEHHIHHHYYCQHCPPLIQANSDDILDLEQQYNSTATQRHLRRRPESKSFQPNASEYRQGRPLILDTDMSVSPTTELGYGSFAPGVEVGSTTKNPIVQNKKKSILGTMSMTSSMRKRFFAEQKKESLQQQGQGRRGSERQVSPLSSSISGFDREDEAYGPSGSGIRARRNQGRPLLEGLSDDDDEYGPDNSSNIQGTQRNNVLAVENGQQEQQRAKFLSRLKRFLLRPSPFAKSLPTLTAGSHLNSSSSTPATPIDTRAAATVRVTKTRWARSGNNLQDHLSQDDLDADRSTLEGQLFYYPSQRESRRRWTHQEMFEPPTAASASAPGPTLTTTRREKLGIRAQFQQQQPSSQLLSPLLPTEVHLPHHHQHHHHHHHHHDHTPGHDHQHHQHLHLAQNSLTAQQQPPQSSPAAMDVRSAADSNSRRSPKSAISVLSSLPMSISATTHEKELSDHDTPPTPCSTAPSNVVTTKEMKAATAAMSFNNASAL
ncbi:unnamed protein product [Mortierella alpina]